MAALFDLVAMTVSSAPGTGSVISLGNAATINGVTYLSFTGAGTPGGTVVAYSILDTGASEIGTSTFLSSGPLLSGRTPTKSTNGNAAISASSAAIILCSLRAEDIISTDLTNSFTAAQQSQLRTNLGLGVITPSGVNIGINSTAPAAPLQVGDSAVVLASGRIRSGTRDSGGGARSWDFGADWSTFGNYSFNIKDTSAAVRFTIDLSGFVQLASYGAGVITSDASGNLTSVAGGLVRTVKVQKFIASGTYVPSAGLLFAIIECVGGGAGGGGISSGASGASYGAAGGGSGGYSRTYATAASVGASQTVTVGAGGAGATIGANGSPGGTTSVGTLCVANGGLGGTFSSGGAIGIPGSGGTPGTGDIAAAGQPGQTGPYTPGNFSVAGGNGGSSIFGGGAIGVGNSGGAAATNYGSGGSGGAQQNAIVNRTGGAGSAGIVIITEYCSV